MKKYLSLFFLLAFIASFISCGEPDTPTKAYARLFAAVKSKSTSAIKAEMSQRTHEFAEFVAKQQNKTIEEVYANGFSQSTFAETLPEVRDERAKDNMGAVEVWNAKGDTWEDLPFILEGSKWKLAIGDAFRGGWKSPGKSQGTRDREAANIMSGNNMVNGKANIDPISNSNVNSKPIPIIRPNANVPKPNSNVNK